MNRSSFALIIALLIHLVFLLLYLRIEKTVPHKKETIPQEKKLKVSLKKLAKPTVRKKTNTPVTKEKPKEIPKMPVMPKGSQLKKIIKKPPIEYKPKAKIKKPKLNPKPKPVKAEAVVKKVQPLPPKSTHITIPKPIKPKQEEIVPPKKKESSAMDWLLEDKSDEIVEESHNNKSVGTSAGRNIKELYGDEFGKLSQGQQEYILNNQEIMRRITQGVLNRQASVSNLQNINVNRSNVIEFYLYPDGSMSDFKFLDKSGYFMLDEITRVTIEYSYAKYPRPNEKTLIRYNVFYNLRRY